MLEELSLFFFPYKAVLWIIQADLGLDWIKNKTEADEGS